MQEITECVSMVVYGTQNLFVDDFLLSSFLGGCFGIIRGHKESAVRLKQRLYYPKTKEMQSWQTNSLTV